MKTKGEFLKELAMNQNLTTEIKLQDLLELLSDNEKLRKRVEELEKRNRLLEEKMSKYEEYYDDEEDKKDTMPKTAFEEMKQKIEELGIKHEYNVMPWEEPKGLWPNGEFIPLELSGLKFYDMYIYNALKRAGIKYIEELRDKTYEWFTSLKNIGKGRADKLQSCLYRTWGFRMKN